MMLIGLSTWARGMFPQDQASIFSTPVSSPDPQYSRPLAETPVIRGSRPILKSQSKLSMVKSKSSPHEAKTKRIVTFNENNDFTNQADLVIKELLEEDTVTVEMRGTPSKDDISPIPVNARKDSIALDQLIPKPHPDRL